MTTVILSSEHHAPILDDTYQLWFDKVKNDNVIYISNEIQIYKLLIEQHEKNINVEKFLIIKDKVSKEVPFNIESISKSIPRYKFRMAKDILKELSFKKKKHSFNSNSKVAVFDSINLIPDANIDIWFDKVKNDKVLYFSNQLQLFKIYLECLRGNVDIYKFLVGKQKSYFEEDGKACLFPEHKTLSSHSWELLMQVINIHNLKKCSSECIIVGEFVKDHGFNYHKKNLQSMLTDLHRYENDFYFEFEGVKFKANPLHRRIIKSSELMPKHSEYCYTASLSIENLIQFSLINNSSITLINELFN